MGRLTVGGPAMNRKKKILLIVVAIIAATVIIGESALLIKNTRKRDNSEIYVYITPEGEKIGYHIDKKLTML